MSAGYPARKFTLVGARTNWNDVAIRLRRHTITVTKLPIQTGVININLRPGVVEGRTGNLTVIAKTRAANARQTASAQASWFR